MTISFNSYNSRLSLWAFLISTLSLTFLLMLFKCLISFCCSRSISLSRQLATTENCGVPKKICLKLSTLLLRLALKSPCESAIELGSVPRLFLSDTGEDVMPNDFKRLPEISEADELLVGRLDDEMYEFSCEDMAAGMPNETKIGDSTCLRSGVEWMGASSWLFWSKSNTEKLSIGGQCCCENLEGFLGVEMQQWSASMFISYEK